MISVNLKAAAEFIPEQLYNEYLEKAYNGLDTVLAGTGAGNDFLGWTSWPKDYDKEEFERIIKAAEEIKANYDVLVVAGIGGSYLGARCAIEALNGLFPTNKTKNQILQPKTKDLLLNFEEITFFQSKTFDTSK